MQVGDKGGAKRPIATAVSGMLGGVCATAIWHPLDLLRTRLSAQGFWATGHLGEKYKGLVDATIKILRQESFAGIYRGVGAATLGSGVSWGVYLSAYHYIKPELGGTAFGNFLAGTSAGVVQVLVTNPIWVIKTRMQLQQGTQEYVKNAPPRYKGVIDGFRVLWEKEGLSGFYRGVTPGLIATTHGGIQFAVIEECKKVMRELRGIRDGEILPHRDIFVASSIGKLIATAITHPVLVVRVRLQDEHNVKTFLAQNEVTYRGLLGSVKTIWRHERIFGFYKGLLPNLLKAVPVSASAITIADIISTRIL